MKYTKGSLVAEFSVVTENAQTQVATEQAAESFFELLETIAKPINGAVEIALLEILHKNLVQAAAEINSVLENEMSRQGASAMRNFSAPKLRLVKNEEAR